MGKSYQLQLQLYKGIDEILWKLLREHRGYARRSSGSNGSGETQRLFASFASPSLSRSLVEPRIHG
jgi:hypothetical protein